MNKNDLYFHIHYCNHKETQDDWRYREKIDRRLRHHEFFLVTGGKGYITVELKKYSVKKGMLFYLKPEVHHIIETDLEEPLNFLSVHFNFIHVNFEDNQWSLKNETNNLKLNTMQEFKDYYVIFNDFKKLVQVWSEKLPSYEFHSKILLQKLLLEIHDNVKKQNTNYATLLKIERVIRYMHENINCTIKLNDLSTLVDLSNTYLSRTFKEITGYSIIEFFNKMKIDKSKEIISVGDKKIKEVSDILGFKDEFYFSRLFKKIEGVSPKEFYSKNVHGY